MSGRRRAVAVLGFGLLGSQAGHLLAYQMRFGAAAQQIQSSGTHAYFPLVAKTALGVASAALIGGLLLVGLARILSGRRARSVSEPSFISLLAVLFSIQLAAFASQEVVESLIAGSTVGSAPDLLLWGALGQLPIAVIAAVGLRWVGVRVEAAVGAIREIVNTTMPGPMAAAPVAIRAYAVQDRALLMARVAGTSLARRGPPSSSFRISQL
jgi:hypothetical protein